MSNGKTPEQQILSNLWWLVLLRGIFLVALGIVFLTRPVVPLTMAILVMGAYWFVDGLLVLSNSIRDRHTIKHWGFNAFVGVVSILAGLVVFSRPVASALLTTTFVVYFLAFAAMVSGMTSLSTGIRMRKEIDNEWYLIIGGGVSILFGLMLIASPMYSILFLVKSLGIIALIVGVVLVVYAMRIRSAVKQAGI
jgi:uncharacterized membrane protein HdeD (DUF308 family)